MQISFCFSRPVLPLFGIMECVSMPLAHLNIGMHSHAQILCLDIACQTVPLDLTNWVPEFIELSDCAPRMHVIIFPCMRLDMSGCHAWSRQFSHFKSTWSLLLALVKLGGCHNICVICFSCFFNYLFGLVFWIDGFCQRCKIWWL